MKVTIKKSLSLCLLIAAAITGLSCKSTPPKSEPITVSEPVSENVVITEEQIDYVFEEVFDHYEAALILDGARNYTVAAGDTLSSIARSHYGHLSNVYDAGYNNGFYFPIIMLASPHHDIADPDFIELGMNLIIPDLQRNLDNPGSRKAIKDCLHDVALIYSVKGDSSTVQGLTTLADSIPQ